MKSTNLLYLLLLFALACTSPTTYDILIMNGQIYDGSGTDSYVGDIGINQDTIAAIGHLKNAKGEIQIDASGLAVSPGFINMLSHSTESLIEDGRSQSDIRQGVTLEVFGEFSMGPMKDKNKERRKSRQGDIKYDIEWNTLGEYLDFLEKKGITPNIASFVSSGVLRINTVGSENRPATKSELDSMRFMVRQAMEEGALGLTTALIYPPFSFANTDELIELCKEASAYDGMYIAHIRGEGNGLLKAIDEHIRITEQAGIRSEIYHLKQAGKNNWEKFDEVVAKIDSARSVGLVITADMYNYIAGATGLSASMPPWVQEGGYQKWVERLKDPKIRKRVAKEMTVPTNDWENMMLLAGSPDKIILIGFKNDSLKHLTGKTLLEVSEMYNLSPEETAMELIIQDGSRVEAVYFLMSEVNVKKQIALPWMSFGSDAESSANEGVFLKSSPHPRAYGNFARLLGKYVRDEKVITLEEAIYKLTSFPASNLKIVKRGALRTGYYADIVMFDPEKIQDHATFENPQQYATGVLHVFVNGIQVLKDGEHTGAMPGKVVRGPGWKPPINKAHNKK